MITTYPENNHPVLSHSSVYADDFFFLKTLWENSSEAQLVISSNLHGSFIFDKPREYTREISNFMIISSTMVTYGSWPTNHNDFV